MFATLRACLQDPTTYTSFVRGPGGKTTAHVYPKRLNNPKRRPLNTVLAVFPNVPAATARKMRKLYPDNCRICDTL